MATALSNEASMVSYSFNDDELVLDLYIEAGRQPLPQDDEEVIKLSSEIGNSPKSIHMKMANFQWFDPERIGGLDGGSWQSWEVWCDRMKCGINEPRQAFNRYSRRDDVMVLALYFEAGRQPLAERDPKVCELSGITGRSAKSVHRRMASYQWLDPERIGGIDTVAKQSREVWNAFAHNEQRLKRAADRYRREAR